MRNVESTKLASLTACNLIVELVTSFISLFYYLFRNKFYARNELSFVFRKISCIPLRYLVSVNRNFTFIYKINLIFLNLFNMNVHLDHAM